MVAPEGVTRRWPKTHGDEDDNDFERAGRVAEHRQPILGRAILGSKTGGYLHAMGNGVRDLANRADGDRHTQVDERSRAKRSRAHSFGDHERSERPAMDVTKKYPLTGGCGAIRVLPDTARLNRHPLINRDRRQQ
jgi:hypothetical protein